MAIIFQNKLPNDTLLTSTIGAFKSGYALIYDTILIGKGVFKINGEMKYSKDKESSKYNSIIDYGEVDLDFIDVIENDKSITIDGKKFNKKLVKLK